MTRAGYDHLRKLPDGSLTREEVIVLIDDIERWQDRCEMTSTTPATATPATSGPADEPGGKVTMALVTKSGQVIPRGVVKRWIGQWVRDHRHGGWFRACVRTDARGIWGAWLRG